MASAEQVYEHTQELLEKQPELEADLREVLAVDAEADTWDFDDVPLDSGQFGEVVSRDLAERTDDGYRLVDRSAMQAAIEGDPPEYTTDEDEATESQQASIATLKTTLRDLSPGTVIGVLIGLLMIAGTRSGTYRSVLREGAVVSPANDPYYFRYVQERLLEQGTLHPAAVADIGQASTRPYTHAMNWWLTELLGGTQGGASLVAGWLPIVAAMASGLVVFAIAVLLTDDRRVGVLSIVLLAVAPVHVTYTSLGFLEHLLHQYFWLCVLVALLIWLAVDLRRRYETTPETALDDRLSARRTWAVVGLLAVTIGITPHIWGGSPLILLPVAIYIALRAIIDGRAGLDPVRALAPTIVAVGGGAVLAYIPHAAWGWRDAFAVYTPALLLVGAVGVTAAATLWYRAELPALGLLASEGVIALLTVLGFRVLAPDAASRLGSRAGDLFFRAGITETDSLYTLERYVVIEPLLQIGPWFYFALPVLGWATWHVYQRYDPAWLLMVVFAWYWAILAGLQVRFAAQFTLVLSVFGAIGIIWALSAIDLVESVSLGAYTNRVTQSISRPDSVRRGAYVGLAIVIIVGASIVVLPNFYSDITYDGEYQVAVTIDEHAEEHNRTYPENFVLSNWGYNRMYNYFVNGEAAGYGYAQSNYEPFLTSTDPGSWYDRFDDRVGYIVIPSAPAPEESTYTKLYSQLGAGANSTAHYQAVHVKPGIRVFAVVDGAQLQVNGPENASVSAQTAIGITGGKQGQRLRYQRTGTITNETATLRVAYPGEYQVQTSTGATDTVQVDQTMIENGDTVSVNLAET